MAFTESCIEGNSTLCDWLKNSHHSLCIQQFSSEWTKVIRICSGFTPVLSVMRFSYSFKLSLIVFLYKPIDMSVKWHVVVSVLSYQARFQVFPYKT